MPKPTCRWSPSGATVWTGRCAGRWRCRSMPGGSRSTPRYLQADTTGAMVHELYVSCLRACKRCSQALKLGRFEAASLCCVMHASAPAPLA